MTFLHLIISLSTKPSRSSMLSQMTIFHISYGLLLIVFHCVCGYSRSIVFPYSPNFLTKDLCNLQGGCLQKPPSQILQSGRTPFKYLLDECHLCHSPAAAKSLQSCPTLGDPIDGSPPGSPSLGFSKQKHRSGLPLHSLFIIRDSMYTTGQKHQIIKPFLTENIV